MAAVTGSSPTAVTAVPATGAGPFLQLGGLLPVAGTGLLVAATRRRRLVTEVVVIPARWSDALLDPMRGVDDPRADGVVALLCADGDAARVGLLEAGAALEHLVDIPCATPARWTGSSRCSTARSSRACSG